MCLSKTASETAELNLKLSVNDTHKLSAMCAERSRHIKNERVETSVSLRHLINKEKVTSTKRQSSTYNKRTFPFEMSDEKHVRALNTITEMFCNPWENSETKRKDLTDDIADFFIAISENDLVVLTAVDYNALVKNQKKKKTKSK